MGIRLRVALTIGSCLLAGSLSTARAEDALAPAPRRLVVSGEALASFANADPGYFNDTSYGRGALRLARARVDGLLRLGGRAALLGEGRVDNGDGLSLAALYLRLRPLRDRSFDIQAGRIPPVFGTFARRGYGSDNPLIGSPLIYQYLTSLRADALPATADDLLVMRGRGWLSHYPLGSATWDRGLPVIAGDRWDTGVEMRVGAEPVSFAAALTQGTLSDPRVRDDNGGKQLSGRLEARPTIGLVLGASVSRGSYLSRDALAAAGGAADGESYTQDGLGFDAEYSRGYWLLRAEGVVSRWAIPAVQSPFLSEDLRSWGGFVEARYKIRPGLFAAARADHLGFSRVTGLLDGGRPTSWEAPVSRVEAGAGYSLRRHVLLKVAVQRDWRQGVTVGRSATLVGAQALLWF
jgi:hypothetical protein